MLRLNKQMRWYFLGARGAYIAGVAQSESKYTHAHTSSLGTILCFTGANPVRTPTGLQMPPKTQGTQRALLKCSIQSTSTLQNVLK